MLGGDNYFLYNEIVYALILLVSIAALFLNSVHAQTFEYPSDALADIKVGEKPQSIAVNAKTNTIYVANSESATLSVINGTTDKVVANVQLNYDPNSVAVNPKTNKIYVGTNNGFAHVIDGFTNKISSTIGINVSPNSLAVNPQTNIIYLQDDPWKTLYAINGSTNEIVSTIQMKVEGDRTRGTPRGYSDSFKRFDPLNSIVVNPTTNMVYAVREGRPYIFAINGSTHEISAAIYMSHVPQGLAVDPKNNRIYVTFYSSPRLAIIDGITNNWYTLLNHRYLNSMKIDILPTTNTIYVANPYSNTVLAINGTSNKLSTSLDVGYYPQYLAVNPETNKIYVTNSGSDTISVINGQITTKRSLKIDTLKKSGIDIPVRAGNPSPEIPGRSLCCLEIAVNTQTNFIYVADGRSDTVSVINGKNDLIVSKIPLEDSPQSLPIKLAINPETNIIYGVNTDSGAFYVIDGQTNQVSANFSIGDPQPYGIAVNPQSNIVYVSNPSYNNILLVNMKSNKVMLPGNTVFNVNPPDAGSIKCNKEEVITNQNLRLPFDSVCVAESISGFEFTSWVENISQNSTKRINPPSKPSSPFKIFFDMFGMNSNDGTAALTLTKSGRFTANFKEIPPSIPTEYWTGLYTIVISSIIGWSIPNIVGSIRRKRELDKLNKLHEKISSLYDDGRLDYNDIESLDKLRSEMNDEYAKGKISDQHYQNLKDEIAVLYEEIHRKRIDSLHNDERQDGRVIHQIKYNIEDAFAKGKISDQHYSLLNKRLEPFVNLSENKSEAAANQTHITNRK